TGQPILPGETDEDYNDASTRQQSLQLRFSMVAVAQDEEQHSQKNYSSDNLTQKLWNRCLTFLFEREVPNVAIYQSDNQRRAQQNRRCSNMKAPRSMHSINRDGGIKSDRQTEKPKQQSKLNTGATL